jgi:hypothetical protein
VHDAKPAYLLHALLVAVVVFDLGAVLAGGEDGDAFLAFLDDPSE